MQDRKRSLSALGLDESTRVLFLLVLTDVAFVVLHVLQGVGVFAIDAMSLQQDQGYAEVYQYLKEYWIVLLFGGAAFRWRSPVYVVWALAFGYVVVDDFLGLHEQWGRQLGGMLPEGLGVPPAALGELLVLGGIGSFLLSSGVLAYRSSDAQSKTVSKEMVLLLGLLVFFGVVVDFIHQLFYGTMLYDVITIVEEGGELFVMSLMVWALLTAGGRSFEWAPASVRRFLRGPGRTVRSAGRSRIEGASPSRPIES